MFTVMVVEDDLNARKLMCNVLSQGGYTPVPAGNGREALILLDEKHIDAVILDVMMPVMDGYEFLSTLREGGDNTPVLIVTAKEDARDKHLGFRLGTDDYMVKPVDEEEMLLRLAAIMRRSRIANEHKLRVGRTVLDWDSLTVTENSKTTVLPQKEFGLLFKLLSYKERIFTRRQLMDEIWEMDSDTDERTVDVHINRLRDRFRDSDDFEIVTVRGLGYKACIKYNESNEE
ncbi:MAG: response regulator transcription factor [Clostridia bacterium]|nr:response regulator transcription factor [Clostridia bacterium]